MTAATVRAEGRLRRGVHVLVAAATSVEVSLLARALRRPTALGVGPWRVDVGRLGAARVAMLRSGIGKANAALALGAVTERLAAGLILSVGVGGAYPDSGLEPGDLAVATEEVYGDEGVETPEGWRGIEAIGLPLCEAPDGTPRWNRLPADAAAGGALMEAALGAGRAVAGPFVTVSTVTGTAKQAARLRARFGGVCESMEGAAFAHGALLRGVAFAEVRGISNAVGPRDRASWRLAEAAEAAQRAAIAFFDAWGPPSE